MKHHCLLAVPALSVCVVAGAAAWAQSPTPPAPQNAPSSAASGAANSNAQAPSSTQVPASTPPANTKKTKKVWTNDDVSGLNGPISVVGSSKTKGSVTAEGKADSEYIANTRKQLQKLQSQLHATDEQLVDLKNFASGKTPSTTGGYDLSKGYNRVPVNQQITNLEAKKADLQGKIDVLLDEARKKGVEPGQLR
ncbi:MAG TPA: hypothetical protein VJN93_02555 [Candidatus Acidoferrum sp.]|nr:hypothetical protein [Candidatus Acidoferrum sp.]